MGPLVSREHRDKVLAYFALAREEGATVVTGGGVPTFGDARDAGAYVEPTIWTGLPESARCIKEEVFGPVCHVAPFDTEEEAIRLANDSRYGLAAAVWTQNLTRGHRVAQSMKADWPGSTAGSCATCARPSAAAAVRHRPRRRPSLAALLHRTHQRLHQAVMPHSSKDPS